MKCEAGISFTNFANVLPSSLTKIVIHLLLLAAGIRDVAVLQSIVQCCFLCQRVLRNTAAATATKFLDARMVFVLMLNVD